MQQIIRTSNQLGQLLQGRRKQLKLSQSALGAQAGISQKRQSALELAPERITVDRLLRLLAALDLEFVVQEKPVDDPADGRDW
jgi:HTH-type transcriptional regulator/antitoxin HipB